ncbi:MAG: InlB B-repeat-containing protein, partial [Candidatus Methanoplasma sp.]|nr:InlB B-repeat-containing protein [Candidatus Methanoplasma sp.]
MRFRLDTKGRVSALVVIAVILIMVAVPFTAIHFDSNKSSGSPLAKVIYDANGGTGTVPSGSIFEQGRDASYVLFDPLPTRTGYVFTGWNTLADGSGTGYNLTTPYEDRKFIGESDVTFYAQWQQIPATSKITLTAATANINVTYNGTNYTYQIGAGAITPLPSNVIYFTGTYGVNCITFQITGGVQFPADNRLYVVLDTLTVTATGDYTGTNFMNIMPGAKIIMQLLGNNTINHSGDTGVNSRFAAIRAVSSSQIFSSDPSQYSDLIISGQGAGSLTITRNVTYDFGTGVASGFTGPDPSIGALIGGDGTNGNASSGDAAGHIQIESGILQLANASPSRIRGACIGGGGTIDGSYNGGEGAYFEMHGGSITTFQQTNGASLTATAIGGGAQFNGASSESGSGNFITITGGKIDITQINSDVTYGLRTAAIGGAGTGTGKAGDSGIIKISGGDITIKQNGASVSGSGIGSGAAQYTGNAPGQATGSCTKSGHDNYISISGGSINITQTNSSVTYGCLTGAGIGGGAGADTGIGGGGADVRISDGYIFIKRESTAAISRAQGAAIGGGAEETKPSNILITGGNINIICSVSGITTEATAKLRLGAAIGSNLNANPNSSVQIDGGVINISRTFGSTKTELTVPIGTNGDFGKSPIINGGSIRASADMDLTSGGTAVFDTQAHSLVRYIVNLENSDNPQSLFVRKSDVKYSEYDLTKRYVDFHVQGRHVNLQNLAQTYSTYNLYLPAGTAADPNEISLEYKPTGEVKTFTAYGGSSSDTLRKNVAVQTSNLQPGDPILYRVVYRLGNKLRYEDDIVHIAAGTLFKQSFRALNANLNDAVAPWSLTYVERHNIDYNNSASPSSLTDVVQLDGQWKYKASENRLVNPPGISEVATAYGNIEFNTGITGRLVITADYTDRVNFIYSDPQLGTITRVMGSGYPDFKIGYAKETDPWREQPGAPIASTPPELSGTIWTSVIKGNDFVEWREGNMQTGTSRNTGDMYGSVIPQGVSTTTYYAMWKAETPTLAITQQPQATVTIDNMSNAVFTVKAISTTSSALTYNWQYWDSGWKDLSGVGFTGADTNMLQISPYNYLSGSTPTFTTGNTFQCVVKDSANNTVYSQPASLVVTGVTGTPPSTPAPYSPNNTIQILTAPDDVTALSGTNAVFSVNAICSSSILYRWQVSTDGGAVWNTIAGATSNTYTAANVSNTDNGKLYRCIMTSTNPTYENIIYTSTPAKLTVISSALYTINVNVAIQNATIGTGGFVQPNSSDKIVNKVTTTTGTPDYSFSAVSGTSQTFTITPIYGNGLVSLKDGGTDIPYTKNPDGTFVFTLTNITAAHNIVATFAPGYLVDVTFAGTGSGSVSFVSQDGTSTGTLNATGQIFVPYNNSVTLTASATAPNVFVSWTGNAAAGGVNSANPAITIGPMGDNSGISETVTFSTTTLTWQLTLDPAGGAAEVSYDGGVTVFQYPGVPMNIPNDKTTTVELKTPPTGKTFSYWYGGTVGGAVGSEVYTDAKFTVPTGNEDKKYTAAYVSSTTALTITVLSDPTGVTGFKYSVIADVWVPTEANNTFKVDPSTPFQIKAPLTFSSLNLTFLGWSGKEKDNDTLSSSGVTANTSFTALYYNINTQVLVTLTASPSSLAPDFTLKQNNVGLSFVTDGNNRVFAVTKNLSFTATAPMTTGTTPVYTLQGWSGEPAGADLTKTINTPMTYTALYYNPLTQAIVTLNPSPNTISPAFTLNQGGDLSFITNTVGGREFIVNMGTPFTATAPMTAGTSPVYNFQGWSGKTSGTATLTDTIPMGGSNQTYTALYYNQLTQAIVTLKADPSTLAPAFTLSQSGNSVPYTVNPAGGMDFIVNMGTAFTATAPMTAGTSPVY